MAEMPPLPPLPFLPDLLENIAKRTTGAMLGAVLKPVGEDLMKQGIQVLKTGAFNAIEGGKRMFPTGIQGFYDRNPGAISPGETMTNAANELTQEGMESLIQFMNGFTFVQDKGVDHLQSVAETMQMRTLDCEDAAYLVSKVFQQNGIPHQRRFGFLIHPNGEREGHAWIELPNGLIWDYNFFTQNTGNYLPSGTW